MKYFITICLSALITFIITALYYEDRVWDRDNLKRENWELMKINARLSADVQKANEIFKSNYYLKGK